VLDHVLSHKFVYGVHIPTVHHFRIKLQEEQLLLLFLAEDGLEVVRTLSPEKTAIVLTSRG